MQTGSDTSLAGAPKDSRSDSRITAGPPEFPRPSKPRSWRRTAAALRIFFRSIEVFLWAAFFIIALLFLGLRYWLLPNVERFREDIVTSVSKALGQPVTVESISADWRGLRPQLDLVNVRLFDTSGREALLLPSVRNVISWRSLLFLDLRLHSFAVDDLKLSVRRDAAGGITIAGMRLSEERGDGSLADWVLGQKEILVTNAEIEWVDEQRGAPPLRLTALTFRLANDDDEHSFGLSARPPRELGTTIDLRAELIGRSVKELRAWNGRVYAEVGNTDLSAWRAWIDYPVDVKSGQGALRLWVTLIEGRLRRAVADVSLTGFAAQLDKELPELRLASVDGRIGGRYTPRGFEFSTRALQFDADASVRMQPTTLKFTLDHPTGGSAMKGAFNATQVEFKPLAHVAEALPFPKEVRRQLAELAPQGSLADTRFEWTGEPAAPASYLLRTRFTSLAMKPWGYIPGFAGLTGSVDVNENKGTLYLASQSADVQLPKVFSEPRIKLDSLTGQVGWELGPNQGLPLQVNLTNLSFANSHLAGSAFGRYTWTGEGPGVIDLSAQLARADARQIWKYLPLVTGPLTSAWVNRAILTGQGSDVRLRLRGNMKDFPFIDPAKGLFQVNARVSRGTLEYVEGWPRIEGVEADLLFERDRMEVVGRKGSIYGASLSGVRVGIAGLGTDTPELSVNGSAEGPTADFLRYTQQPAMRSLLDGATDGMQATGRGQLRLKLELPLADTDRPRIAGSFQFAGNTLNLDKRLPSIEKATGRIEFSESSLTVRDVRGSAFGGNVAINGGTRPEGGISVTARGEATVAGMRGYFDHPWKRYLSGGAPYVATLQTRPAATGSTASAAASAAGSSTRVVFESNLRGVASELPAPLAKAAQDLLPLRVEVAPTPGGDRIQLALGNAAAALFANPSALLPPTSASAAAPPASGLRSLYAELLRSRQGETLTVMRTGVGINEPARVPERNGLLLSGSLPTFSLDRWLPLLRAAEAGPASPAGSATAAMQAGTPVAAPPTASVDMRLGSLDVSGKRLSNVVLRAGVDARGWQANITTSEVGGELTYRGEGRGKLMARLAYFSPPPDSPIPRAAANVSNDYPAVDLVVERFSFRGKQLGRVEVLAQPEGANWRLERVASLNPEASLIGKGLWSVSPVSRTAMEFTLDINDVGRYLDRIGYPDTVKAGKAKLTGSVAWFGDPLNMDYPSLSGDLSLQAENGQFLEIEPGIGKLVSLMSLQMLPRRMALDFRDVFSKGFAFDRISSSMQIERGVMRTKDFRMRGPAAEVDIKGETDLARETQRLEVRVIPELGSTASTVVGFINPLAGVATMIAQRLLKNPLGQVFSFDYIVTGTWADPKVDKASEAPAPVPVPQTAPGAAVPPAGSPVPTPLQPAR